MSNSWEILHTLSTTDSINILQLTGAPPIPTLPPPLCSSVPYPCYPGVSCEDSPQGPRCGACPARFTGDGRTCKPISRCAESPCYPGKQILIFEKKKKRMLRKFHFKIKYLCKFCRCSMCGWWKQWIPMWPLSPWILWRWYYMSSQFLCEKSLLSRWDFQWNINWALAKLQAYELKESLTCPSKCCHMQKARPKHSVTIF